MEVHESLICNIHSSFSSAPLNECPKILDFPIPLFLFRENCEFSRHHKINNNQTTGSEKLTTLLLVLSHSPRRNNRIKGNKY